MVYGNSLEPGVVGNQSIGPNVSDSAGNSSLILKLEKVFSFERPLFLIPSLV